MTALLQLEKLAFTPAFELQDMKSLAKITGQAGIRTDKKIAPLCTVVSETLSEHQRKPRGRSRPEGGHSGCQEAE